MEAVRKSRRLPRRFSLRFALTLLTVGTLLLGRWSYVARRRDHAIRQIRQAGGEVFFAHQSTSPQTSPPAVQQWIAEWFGESYAYRVVSVSAAPDSRTSKDEVLRGVLHLGSVESLSMDTPASGRHVGQGTCDARLDDGDVDKILDSLPHLKIFHAAAHGMSSDSVERLLADGRFENLSLHHVERFGSVYNVRCEPARGGGRHTWCTLALR